MIPPQSHNTPVRVVEGKLCINGRIFEHSELLAAKEELQNIGATSDEFFEKNLPDRGEEIEEIKEIIEKMARLSPLTWHSFLLDNRVHGEN
tara:strand:+ start:161 stop:433 length:273 start_codon:yes stop_codon:yes gene_type:complete